MTIDELKAHTDTLLPNFELYASYILKFPLKSNELAKVLEGIFMQGFTLGKNNGWAAEQDKAYKGVF